MEVFDQPEYSHLASHEKLQARRIPVRGTTQAMRRAVPSLVLILSSASQSFPADFSYAGMFAQDDENRQFVFTLAQPGNVTVRTLSYAGGVNAAGVQVPRGGFDPTLSMFDAAGNLFAANRDGGCASVSPDAITSLCFDANIAMALPAGTWRVVLTQSENLPNGPTLADGFAYDGAGNFTADPEGADQQGFWDFYPNRRAGSYALDIHGADASAIPIDPKVAGIVNSASYLAGDPAPNAILSLFDPQLDGGQDSIVTINGINVQVLYSGPGQINYVMPAAIAPQKGAMLNVSRNGSLVLVTSVNVVDAFPGLFTTTQTGTGQAAVLNVLPAGGLTLNGAVSPAEPAKRGTYLTFYATGFGGASAPDASGLSWLIEPVTATIGSLPATVTFAGLAPQSTNGLQQINVLIPDDCPTGRSVTVRLQVGTHFTQTGTTVAIQ